MMLPGRLASKQEKTDFCFENICIFYNNIKFYDLFEIHKIL